MNATQHRLLELATRCSRASFWITLNGFSEIDAQLLDQGRALAREAIAAGDETAARDILEEHDVKTAEHQLREAQELRRLLLVHHPDLAAGFPTPESPDHFTPTARAEQVSAILANLAQRFKVDSAPTDVKAAIPAGDDPTPWPATMTPKEIAKLLGEPEDATRKKLERLDKILCCRIDDEDVGVLYRTAPIRAQMVAWADRRKRP